LSGEAKGAQISSGKPITKTQGSRGISLESTRGFQHVENLNAMSSGLIGAEKVKEVGKLTIVHCSFLYNKVINNS
jgi:hypothetical protein